MASNEIPKTYEPLIELMEDAADGARDHGAAAGLEQNTEAAIRADLEALAGKAAGPGNVPPAVPGLKALWNTAKTNKVTQSGVFRSAKSNGRAVASACVNVLKPRLGNTWTNAWQEAGFTAGSLAMPDNPLAMLQQLRAYFAANPTHEVPGLAAGIDATAAACEAAAQAISTTSTASNQSNADAGTAKSNLEAGLAAASHRMSGLRQELAQLLDDDDDRWYAFGFDKPADPETPEVPENLVATAGAAGSRSIAFDWDDARRAESYRITLVNAATSAVAASQIVTDSDAAGVRAGRASRSPSPCRNQRKPSTITPNSQHR
jgi:hypothetical protein